MRATQERAGSEFRRIDEGWVVRTQALPAVRWLNHVYVTDSVELDDVARLADEHLAGLPYRSVVFEDGSTLEPRLVAAGWKVEHDVVMALEQPPDPGAAADAVIEAPEEDMMGLMRRWHTEEDLPQPAELEQLVESARLQARAGNERHFGIADPDGRLVAMANLRSDGTTAQVENVYTVAEAGGRGYARTLVAHAAGLAAGHELTFIEADDDWPKDLYARLGFRPIGRRTMFYSAA